MLKAVAPAMAEIKFVRLEALADASLPAHGPGRTADGGFVVTNVALSFIPPSGEAIVSVKLRDGKADFEQAGFTAAQAIDTDARSGWAIHPAVGKDHVATFEIAPEVHVPAGSTLVVTIDQQRPLTRTRSASFGCRSPVQRRLALARALPPERGQLVAARGQLQQRDEPAGPAGNRRARKAACKAACFPKSQDVPIHIRGGYAPLGSPGAAPPAAHSGRRSATAHHQRQRPPRAGPLGRVER